MIRSFASVFARVNKTATRSVGVAAALLVLQGCGDSGPKLAEVEGVVTLDGKPLSGVMLEFQPTGGKGSPSVGYTDKNGEYRLRFSRDKFGAVPGEHIVRIDFDYDPGSGDPKPSFKIPAQYNKSSDLRRKLVAGPNSFAFDLSSKVVATRADKTRTR